MRLELQCRQRLNEGQSVGTSSIEIILGGDSECDAFIEALEFVLTTLKAQRIANGFLSEEEIDFR